MGITEYQSILPDFVPNTGSYPTRESHLSTQPKTRVKRIEEMPSSSYVVRPNACKACTRAKRSCDRGVPRCGRCIKRLIECQYFGKFGPAAQRTRPTLLAPRPERPHPTETDIHKEESYHPHASHTWGETGSRLLICQSRRTQAPEIQVPSIDSHPWPEPSFRSSHIPQSIFIPAPHYKHHPLSPDILSQQGWFLHPDSWEVKRTYTASPPDPRTVFGAFVSTVKGWLRDFSTKGHNIFIHKQLYHSSGGGMTSCVQDAWLTLTAYLTKTDQTEDMILQILDERARSLLSTQQTATVLDARAHLARTHALLIYTLIRLLFDNPPIQRTQAVDTLPVLSMWCQQLRETAITQAPGLFQADIPNFHGSSTTNEDKIEQTSLWHAFIISESIRRTWMLVSATLRIFQPWPAKNDQDCLDLSTVTQNRCLGFLSFTIRAGLWEAKSASEWAHLHTSHCGGPRLVDLDHATNHNDIPTDGQLWSECTKKVITTFIQDTGTSVTPIFLESVGIVDKVLEETRPEDVDEWTNQIFRMGLAGEKIDAWDRKSRRRVMGD